jgi:hypothetical protein
MHIYQQVGPQRTEARTKTSAKIRSLLSPQQAEKYDRLIAGTKEQ